MIYFIGNKEQKVVKIGYTLDRYIRGRFLTVQTNCPFDVEVFLTVNGMKNTEKHFHNLFKNDHIKGEWYKLSYDIEHYINNPVCPNITETFKPLLVKISGDIQEEIEILYSQNTKIPDIAAKLGYTYSQVRSHITRRQLHIKYKHIRRKSSKRGSPVNKKHNIPEPLF